MKENKAIVAAVFLLVITIILITGCEEKAESIPTNQMSFDGVERHGSACLTVIEGDKEIFRYEGSIEIWRGSDSGTYGIVYMDGILAK